MKYKLIKLISIALIAVFAWQPECQAGCLRPVAARERMEDGGRSLILLNRILNLIIQSGVRTGSANDDLRITMDVESLHKLFRRGRLNMPIDLLRKILNSRRFSYFMLDNGWQFFWVGSNKAKVDFALIPVDVDDMKVFKSPPLQANKVSGAIPEDTKRNPAKKKPTAAKQTPRTLSQKLADTEKFIAIRKALNLTIEDYAFALSVRRDKPLSFGTIEIYLAAKQGRFVPTAILERALSIYNENAGSCIKTLRERRALTYERFSDELKESGLSDPPAADIIRRMEEGLEFVPCKVLIHARKINRGKSGQYIRGLRDGLRMSRSKFEKALGLNSDGITINAMEIGEAPVPDWIMFKAQELAAANKDKPVPSAEEKAALRKANQEEFLAMMKALDMTCKEYTAALNENSDMPLTESTIEMCLYSSCPSKHLDRARKIYKTRAPAFLEILRRRRVLTAEQFARELNESGPSESLSPQDMDEMITGARPIPPEILIKAVELDRERIGAYLRSLRLQAGLSQSKFGVALQPDSPVLNTVISNMERGRDKIPDWLIFKAQELATPRLTSVLVAPAYRSFTESTSSIEGERKPGEAKHLVTATPAAKVKEDNRSLFSAAVEDAGKDSVSPLASIAPAQNWAILQGDTLSSRTQQDFQAELLSLPKGEMQSIAAESKLSNVSPESPPESPPSFQTNGDPIPFLDFIERAQYGSFYEAQESGAIPQQGALLTAETALPLPKGGAQSMAASDEEAQFVNGLTDKTYDIKTIKFRAQEIASQTTFDVPKKIDNAQDAWNVIFNNPTNARNFFKLASMLRTVCPYDLTRYDKLGKMPLQYARDEGLIFKLGQNLYMTPITDSFRRHTIFALDDEGRRIFAYEVLIPGDSKNRVETGVFRRREVIRNIREGFPRNDYCENSLFQSFCGGTYEFYGKTDYYEKFEIMAFDYPEDGKRLICADSQMMDLWAERAGLKRKDMERRIVEQIAEITASIHALEYVAHAYNQETKEIFADNGLHNFRIIVTDKGVKVKLAGDVANYRRLYDLHDRLLSFFNGDRERKIDIECVISLEPNKVPKMANVLRVLSNREIKDIFMKKYNERLMPAKDIIDLKSTMELVRWGDPRWLHDFTELRVSDPSVKAVTKYSSDGKEVLIGIINTGHTQSEGIVDLKLDNLGIDILKLFHLIDETTGEDIEFVPGRNVFDRSLDETRVKGSIYYKLGPGKMHIFKVAAARPVKAKYGLEGATTAAPPPKGDAQSMAAPAEKGENSPDDSRDDSRDTTLNSIVPKNGVRDNFPDETAAPAPDAKKAAEEEAGLGLGREETPNIVNTYRIEGVECNLERGFYLAPRQSLSKHILELYLDAGITVGMGRTGQYQYADLVKIDEVLLAHEEGREWNEEYSREVRDVIMALYDNPADFKKSDREKLLIKYRLLYTNMLYALGIRARGQENSEYSIVVKGNYPEYILKLFAEYIRDYSKEELLLEPSLSILRIREFSLLSETYKKRLEDLLTLAANKTEHGAAVLSQATAVRAARPKPQDKPRDERYAKEPRPEPDDMNIAPGTDEPQRRPTAAEMGGPAGSQLSYSLYSGLPVDKKMDELYMLTRDFHDEFHYKVPRTFAGIREKFDRVWSSSNARDENRDAVITFLDGKPVAILAFGMRISDKIAWDEGFFVGKNDRAKGILSYRMAYSSIDLLLNMLKENGIEKFSIGNSDFPESGPVKKTRAAQTLSERIIRRYGDAVEGVVRTPKGKISRYYINLNRYKSETGLPLPAPISAALVSDVEKAAETAAGSAEKGDVSPISKIDDAIIEGLDANIYVPLLGLGQNMKGRGRISEEYLGLDAEPFDGFVAHAFADGMAGYFMGTAGAEPLTYKRILHIKKDLWMALRLFQALIALPDEQFSNYAIPQDVDKREISDDAYNISNRIYQGIVRSRFKFQAKHRYKLQKIIDILAKTYSALSNYIRQFEERENFRAAISNSIAPAPDAKKAAGNESTRTIKFGNTEPIAKYIIKLRMALEKNNNREAFAIIIAALQEVCNNIDGESSAMNFNAFMVEFRKFMTRAYPNRTGPGYDDLDDFVGASSIIELETTLKSRWSAAKPRLFKAQTVLRNEQIEDKDLEAAIYVLDLETNLSPEKYKKVVTGERAAYYLMRRDIPPTSLLEVRSIAEEPEIAACNIGWDRSALWTIPNESYNLGRQLIGAQLSDKANAPDYWFKRAQLDKYAHFINNPPVSLQEIAMAQGEDTFLFASSPLFTELINAVNTFLDYIDTMIELGDIDGMRPSHYREIRNTLKLDLESLRQSKLKAIHAEGIDWFSILDSLETMKASMVMDYEEANVRMIEIGRITKRAQTLEKRLRDALARVEKKLATGKQPEKPEDSGQTPWGGIGEFNLKEYIRNGKNANEVAELAARDIQEGMITADEFIASLNAMANSEPQHAATCRKVAEIARSKTPVPAAPARRSAEREGGAEWASTRSQSGPFTKSTISTLVSNYKDAISPYTSLDEAQEEAINGLELPELQEYIKLRNKTILKACYNLLKSLTQLLEPKTESIIFVYPFSGTDAVSSAVAKTFIINLDERDANIGARYLAQALEPDISEKDILRNVINKAPALNAIKAESYVILDDPNRKSCVLLLKGFSDFAGRNFYNIYNDETEREKALHALLSGILGRLREGDRVLVLDSDDAASLQKMGVTDNNHAISLVKLDRVEALSFDGLSFIIPDTVLVLTKRGGRLEYIPFPESEKGVRVNFSDKSAAGKIASSRPESAPKAELAMTERNAAPDTVEKTSTDATHIQSSFFYALFKGAMGVFMPRMMGNTSGNNGKDDQKSENYIQKIYSLHSSVSPLSIESPTVNKLKNEIIPTTTSSILNPDINGPTISVATQILLMSRRVFARFSRWRFVNFIKLNVSNFTRLVKGYGNTLKAIAEKPKHGIGGEPRTEPPDVVMGIGRHLGRLGESLTPLDAALADANSRPAAIGARFNTPSSSEGAADAEAAQSAGVSPDRMAPESLKQTARAIQDVNFDQFLDRIIDILTGIVKQKELGEPFNINPVYLNIQQVLEDYRMNYGDAISLSLLKDIFNDLVFKEHLEGERLKIVWTDDKEGNFNIFTLDNPIEEDINEEAIDSESAFNLTADRARHNSEIEILLNKKRKTRDEWIRLFKGLASELPKDIIPTCGVISKISEGRLTVRKIVDALVHFKISFDEAGLTRKISIRRNRQQWVDYLRSCAAQLPKGTPPTARNIALLSKGKIDTQRILAVLSRYSIVFDEVGMVREQMTPRNRAEWIGLLKQLIGMLPSNVKPTVRNIAGYSNGLVSTADIWHASQHHKIILDEIGIVPAMRASPKSREEWVAFLRELVANLPPGEKPTPINVARASKGTLPRGQIYNVLNSPKKNISYEEVGMMRDVKVPISREDWVFILKDLVDRLPSGVEPTISNIAGASNGEFTYVDINSAIHNHNIRLGELKTRYALDSQQEDVSAAWESANSLSEPKTPPAVQTTPKSEPGAPLQAADAPASRSPVESTSSGEGGKAVVEVSKGASELEYNLELEAAVARKIAELLETAPRRLYDTDILRALLNDPELEGLGPITVPLVQTVLASNPDLVSSVNYIPLLAGPIITTKLVEAGKYLAHARRRLKAREYGPALEACDMAVDLARGETENANPIVQEDARRILGEALDLSGEIGKVRPAALPEMERPVVIDIVLSQMDEEISIIKERIKSRKELSSSFVRATRRRLETLAHVLLEAEREDLDAAREDGAEDDADYEIRRIIERELNERINKFIAELEQALGADAGEEMSVSQGAGSNKTAATNAGKELISVMAILQEQI